MVFGIDDEAIEDAVARVLAVDGLTLGLAESLTGGLAASRLVNVPGASGWFRGSVVSYASEVKFTVLGVPPGPVVSEAAAMAMADGARRVLGSDVGLAITGVAGPASQDDQPPGTVFVGLSRSGEPTRSFAFNVPGRPGPGAPVRHHRRPRPAAPQPGRPGPGVAGWLGLGRGLLGRRGLRRSVVDGAGAGGGAAVVVTGCRRGPARSRCCPATG